jgi:predicted metal-binding membrane protein
MTMPIDATLEAVLRRDRLVVATALSAVVAVSWAYLLASAGMGMSAFEMTRMSQVGIANGMSQGGMAGMTMTAPIVWTPGNAILMFLMWWVMMVGMMLPSAAPMILLFAAVNRKQRVEGNPHVPTGLFMLSYLVAWGGFSLAATGLQWGLSRTGLLSPGMATTSALLAGSLVLAAGLYQLTSVKHACLRHCRLPVHFLASHWRGGAAGALRMGLAHGAYCVGCCWFLMLLLFAGGVMNLHWIAGLALFVLLEKLVPAGHWLSCVAGIGLAAAGAWLLFGAN